YCLFTSASMLLSSKTSSSVTISYVCASVSSDSDVSSVSSSPSASSEFSSVSSGASNSSVSSAVFSSGSESQEARINTANNIQKSFPSIICFIASTLV